jgi:hypothetical protein
MSMEQPKRGERFVHSRQLDLNWVPGPGQRYADAPNAVMSVTRVSVGRVWYGRGASAAWVIDIERLPEIVKEWLP